MCCFRRGFIKGCFELSKLILGALYRVLRYEFRSVSVDSSACLYKAKLTNEFLKTNIIVS